MVLGCGSSVPFLLRSGRPQGRVAGSCAVPLSLRDLAKSGARPTSPFDLHGSRHGFPRAQITLHSAMMIVVHGAPKKPGLLPGRAATMAERFDMSLPAASGSASAIDGSNGTTPLDWTLDTELTAEGSLAPATDGWSGRMRRDFYGP